MTVTALYQDGPWDGITEELDQAWAKIRFPISMPEPRKAVTKVGRYVRTEIVVYKYAGEE